MAVGRRRESLKNLSAAASVPSQTVLRVSVTMDAADAHLVTFVRWSKLPRRFWIVDGGGAACGPGSNKET